MRSIKNHFTLLLSFIFFSQLSQHAFSQEFTGKAASVKYPGASRIVYEEGNSFPALISFAENTGPETAKWREIIRQVSGSKQNFDFELIRTETDPLGFTHHRYRQLISGVPVYDGIFIVHEKNGRIISMNGKLTEPSAITNFSGAYLSPDFCREKAISHVGAVRYKWQMPEEEMLLAYITGNPDATYYPSAELFIVPVSGNFEHKELTIAYAFDIYADEPLYRKLVFIDAESGNFLFEMERIYTTSHDTEANATGTAVTRYSGTRTITTDSYSGSYRLRETGRGNGIETYDMNKGTNYGSAVDFTDADNYWNNVNSQQDEVATDAHWATEMSYDYYYTKFGRNSIDNNGFKLVSYVHYSSNYVNAFWDGQRMTYGDGNSTYSPLTTVDICGHEITHGLTTYTANLTYQNESGALNEGFSDIFGTAIEFFAKPPLTPNWTVGEDIGSPFRSMANPNAYSLPDTYLGTYWYTGTGDNGGVHTNCGVMAYWFYLLCMGGSDTNDIGNAFSVQSITMDKAEAIAYRLLVYYLTPSSNYANARTLSLQACQDLYGGCSFEAQQVTNAWYAVGVGPAFTSQSTTSNFSASQTLFCATPASVQFTNLSTNANTFLWYFGDGTTSTQTNPVHTYTVTGDYDVKLVSYGGSCGTDSTIRTAYINVDAQNPCTYIMPTSGSQTQTACNGILFDEGGPSGNYGANHTATFTISPPGATSITITFPFFDIEAGDNGSCNYDYVEIYNGPNTSSPLVGRYCNLTGNTPPASIVTGSSATIKFYSDGGLELQGFEMHWQCTNPMLPPAANFSAAATTTCTGVVQFNDLSTNAPNAWLWDFGDGNTSTLQNPLYTYTGNGTFTVTLIAYNNNGNDTEIKSSYITVNMPSPPAANDVSRCGNGTVTLTASGSGAINWYTQAVGGTSVGTGSTYTTPALSTTTSYFVEQTITNPTQNTGKTNNSGGGGNLNSSVQQGLIFDCHVPMKLVSVLVYASGTANRKIILKNSANQGIDSVTVSIPNGTSRVTLNFNIQPGTGYKLMGQTYANLYRNNAGVAYPYEISGLVSIHNSTAGPSYYYYYYDWEVQEAPCISNRDTVNAIILPPQTASVSPAGVQSICSGSQLQLYAGTAPGQTYQWFRNGSQIFGATDTLFTVTQGGTYHVQVTGQCGTANSATVQVNVIPLPVSGNITPANPSVCSGSSQALVLNGYSGNIQWQSLNGGVWTNISGALASVYNTPTLVSSTTFRAVVSNGNCTADTSAAVTVSVVQPPLSGNISAMPATICAGDFSVLTLSGYTGGISWQTNASGSWMNIPGATTATYTTTALNTSTSFRAVTSNSICPDAISQPVTVNVTAQLLGGTATASSDTICDGNPALIVLTGQTGNIQWQINNGGVWTDIPSANNDTLFTAALNSQASFRAYTYSQACQSAFSNEVVIDVQAYPVAGSLTASAQIICTGDTVSLTGSPSNATSLSWLLNGYLISGHTNPLLVSVAGNYQMIASNFCGSDTSAVISIQSFPDPSLILLNNLPVEGCAGDTLTLSAGVTGQPLLQWYLDGNQVSGAETSVLDIISDGNYMLVASNACFSDTLHVTAVFFPVPATPFIYSSGDTLYSDAPFGNQWYDNGNAISGATDAFYYPGIPGLYYTIVTINNCSSEPSNIIQLVTGISENTDRITPSVYPNPASDFIMVSFENPGKTDVEIQMFNATGSCVMKARYLNEEWYGQSRIPTSEFAEGMYFISIKTPDNLFTEKIIIHK